MGTKAGWPDIEIFVPGDQTYCGVSLSIFIEVKGRKGQLTQSQREIRDRLEEVGAFWALCRSVDQVQEFLGTINQTEGEIMVESFRTGAMYLSMIYKEMKKNKCRLHQLSLQLRKQPGENKS